MNNLLNKTIFKHKKLNTFYLKRFKTESKGNFQVWKKNGKYYVAIGVISVGDCLYAEETIDYGTNIVEARKYCDELRQNYILNEVKRYKNLKKIY